MSTKSTGLPALPAPPIRISRRETGEGGRVFREQMLLPTHVRNHRFPSGVATPQLSPTYGRVNSTFHFPND